MRDRDSRDFEHPEVDHPHFLPVTEISVADDHFAKDDEATTATQVTNDKGSRKNDIMKTLRLIENRTRTNVPLGLASPFHTGGSKWMRSAS